MFVMKKQTQNLNESNLKLSLENGPTNLFSPINAILRLESWAFAFPLLASVEVGVLIS